MKGIGNKSKNGFIVSFKMLVPFLGCGKLPQPFPVHFFEEYSKKC